MNTPINSEAVTAFEDAIVSAGGRLGRMLRRAVLLSLIGVAISLGAIDLAANDRDTTDGAKRSGMTPHTDAATGCEYLSVSGGGLTPRLNATGQHRGCRK